MKNYTDTHFHLLSMKEKDIDITNLNIKYGMDIGTDIHDIEKRKELISLFPNIKYSIGAGPWSLSYNENIDYLTTEIKKDILSNTPSFIGEIGLDYFHKYSTREKQIDLFIKQLILANELNLPVVIHNRDANLDTIEALEKIKVKKGGIIHCFSADEDFLSRALDLGFYISFAGNITYKKNTNLQEIIKKVPLDRLLLETDSPYLTPVPFRGKENQPAYVKFVAQQLAELKEISVEEVDKITTKNAEIIFKLPTNSN